MVMHIILFLMQIMRIFSFSPRSMDFFAQPPFSEQELIIISTVIGLLISAIIIVTVVVCASCSARREKRIPEHERGAVYWTMKSGELLIDGYICLFAIIIAVTFFLVPFIFTPNLAIPIVIVFLIGVLITVVISYILGRREREKVRETHGA